MKGISAHLCVEACLHFAIHMERLLQVIGALDLFAKGCLLHIMLMPGQPFKQSHKLLQYLQMLDDLSHLKESQLLLPQKH